jgi:hypothetical protein
LRKVRAPEINVSEAETMDQIPFPEDEEQQENEPFNGGNGRGRQSGSPAKAAYKPVPLGKILGITAGALVALLIVTILIAKMMSKPKAQEEFGAAIPQPTMTSEPVAQNQPTPAGQGPTAAQAGQFAGQMQQQAMSPNGQPMNNGGQPGQFVSGNQQPGSPVGQAPQYATAQPTNVQTAANNGIATPQPATAGSMQPQFEPGAVQPLQPQAVAPQPMQQQAAQQQSGQQGFGPAMNQQPAPMAQTTSPQAGGSAQTPTLPQGVVSPGQGAQAEAAPRASAALSASDSIENQIAALRTAVEQIQRRLAQMPAPSARRVHGAPVQVAKADAGTTADPAPATPVEQEHPDRQTRVRPITKRATVDADKSGHQDMTYVLTGTIGGRAFIQKKGSTDVNPDMSVVAGGTLEDGRKVIMVDEKLRRVWLSGNQYIAEDAGN